MIIEVGQVVTIAGHRCSYRVERVYGAEDGTLRLTLMPTVAPFLTTTLEGVIVTDEGYVVTEQAEQVDQVTPPVVEVEEPEAHDAGQIELF